MLKSNTDYILPANCDKLELVFGTIAGSDQTKQTNISNDYFFHFLQNSTPSLTPSASPSISGARKPSAPAPTSQNGPKPNAPPPPPPPSNSKPQGKAPHPVAKPPPPPAPGGSNPPARPPARAQSFNQVWFIWKSPSIQNSDWEFDYYWPLDKKVVTKIIIIIIIFFSYKKMKYLNCSGSFYKLSPCETTVR